MGIFSKLSSAALFEKSKYCTEGMYIAEIKAVKLVNGFKGDSFVIEASVVAVKSHAEGAPQPGETVAHVWRCSGEKQQMGIATFMQFMSAVFGCEPDEKTDKEWETLSAKVIDENALEGTDMVLEVFNTTTKAGGQFTYHKWLHPAEEKDYAQFGIKKPA